MSHLFQSFSKHEINVFFDESGKGMDRPNLLGALSIPRKSYESDDMQYINHFLRKKVFKIHWKNYNGDLQAKRNIEYLIDTLLLYKQLVKLNIINYHYGFLKGDEHYSQLERETVIYSKFPERLIYGLIRGYGNEMRVVSNIYIDKSTEYERLQLDQILKTTLNSHSLYRGEKFYAQECIMYSKNKEIGLELTDILLGITRVIILNPFITENTGKITKAKINLVVELLQNKDFKALLENMKYYEWRGGHSLNQVHFSDYISSFLIQQT